MNTKIITEFLTGLSSHNSKEWMAENKEEYKSALAEFESLVQALIEELSKEDASISGLSAHDLVFRLNRDTRFSRDKSPYNPTFRAHISSCGRMPVPVGYFIQIAPDDIFLGGGLFASQFAEATGMIRDAIVRNGKRFEEIVSEPEFAENYTLMGEKLKKMPRGYEDCGEFEEYLKHKSWFLEYHMKPELLWDAAGFIELAKSKFLLMRPFNEFLNQALKDFKMPER